MTDELIKKFQFKWWNDTLFTGQLVDIEVFEYYMNFKVYEVCSPFNEQGILYNGKCGPTENFEEAHIYIEGFIKWDGCSDITFGDSDCMVHFCRIEEITELRDVIARLYEVAKDNIPNWNG